MILVMVACTLTEIFFTSEYAFSALLVTCDLLEFLGDVCLFGIVPAFFARRQMSCGTFGFLPAFWEMQQKHRCCCLCFERLLLSEINLARLRTTGEESLATYNPSFGPWDGCV